MKNIEEILKEVDSLKSKVTDLEKSKNEQELVKAALLKKEQCYIADLQHAESVILERTKELKCLYDILEFFETAEISLKALFEKTSKSLSSSLLYPEIAECIIVYNGDEYKTANYKETKWKLKADICIDKIVVGNVTVCYLLEKPNEDFGPFLEEEKALIMSVSKQLGRLLERKRAEKIQEVLYNISFAGNTSGSLEKLIAFIQKELEKIIDTSNFYVALYEKKTDSFSLPYHRDEKLDISSINSKQTLTNYVLKTKQSLLANEAIKSELVKSNEIELFDIESKIWLGVPLMLKGLVMGVLAVKSYDNENAYSKSDLEMLEFVSGQISTSIDRMKTDENLKIAFEKASESDRLKSSFLSTMSHELRTPLNAIIGFSDLINENTPIKKVINFADIINVSGKQLLNIVDDIFDITLLDAGKAPLKKEFFALNSILKVVNKGVSKEQQRLQKSHISLNLVMPDDKYDVIVNTDLKKFKQILFNLLRNALKFTNVGNVSFGYRLELDAKAEQRLVIFVEDSGIGITEKQQDVIFDAFRQADESSTRKYGGTGLGLSISQKLVNILGGKLWLNSKEAKGTTFFFSISNDDFKVKKKERKINNESLNIFEGKTVLIVEDDINNFNLINLLLIGSGIKTIWSKNGKEAIRQCLENKELDVVLMDMNMPIMNGYVATKEIKTIFPKLPIIAQTAFALAGDREKALAAGCDDYLSKPVSKTQLFLALEKHITI